MTRDKVIAEVRSALTMLTETDAGALGVDEDLSAVLGLDSLGRLELLSEMEERFDLTIYDIDSERAGTIGGMADLIIEATAEQKECA